MEATPEHAPPSLRDLARTLGLSASTVSRALRNAPNVRPETRARVLAAARQGDYHSHALVNALMTQVRQGRRLKPTGEVLAYLTSFSSEADWRRHPALAQQFEGAAQRARELGFHLQPLWLGDHGADSRKLARILRARGVRGSLLAPVYVDHYTLELDWAHHAVVTFGYSFRQIALHRAVHDHSGLMTACWSHLHKLGHRRIGLVMHRSDSERVRHLWINSYLGCQWRQGGPRLEPLLLDDYHDAATFFRWLKTGSPDALIGIWQDFALRWLQERGLRVPEDLGYATLDLGDRAGKLAGMLQDNHGIGAAAMDLLAGQLFRNETGIPGTPKVTLIEGTWMDGPTVSRRAVTC